MVSEKMHSQSFSQLERACFSLHWHRPSYRRLPGTLCRTAAYPAASRKIPYIRNFISSCSCTESLRYKQSHHQTPSSGSGCGYRCLFGTKKAPGLCNHWKWCTLPRCCRPEGASSCRRHSYYRNCKYCRNYRNSLLCRHTSVYCDQSGRQDHGRDTGRSSLFSSKLLFYTKALICL